KMKRTVPRSTLRKIIKKHKPHLRFAGNADLLLILFFFFLFFGVSPLLKVHLSFLLFLHRLAGEARTIAFEYKSKTIKPEHMIAAAKVIM
ncbi:CENPW protein, partial [Rhinopomastus cyanomelas]|nr:CENPW protein [Rhinopomastus cyanomelas]